MPIFVLVNFVRRIRRNRGWGLLIVGVVLCVSVLGNAVSFYLFDRTVNPDLSFPDAVWYSIISITTIGYGDLSAQTLGARIGTVVFIVFLGLTTFTAFFGILIDVLTDAILMGDRDVGRENEIPTPPFWGSRVVEGIGLTDIFGMVNPTALFSVQWQLKRGKRSKEDYAAMLREEAHPRFEEMKARCLGEDILRPRVVYGYLPCSSDGDDLVIFDAEDHNRETHRFTFPRQGRGKRLCISDFYRDLGECDLMGRRDVIGMMCVTMGERISAFTKELFDGDRYQEYLYWHGLGVESAEGLAELWHKRIRQELGFGHEDSPEVSALFQQKYRGSRYSFGYPACPEMSDHAIMWELIDPTRIGCSLTENFQIDPEQSTCAIVAHHPEARYFNA